MRSVPNAAVMFVTYEVASKWLLKKQIEQSNKNGEKVEIDLPLKKTQKMKKFIAFTVPLIKTNQFSSLSRLWVCLCFI